METAQLSYFLLACQFRNHAEAAARSGLSPSVLSENIDALERELGLALFQRGPRGHYPTEAARWLFQTAEPLLMAAEAVPGFFAGGGKPREARLEVRSPLQFMAGSLSRAASLAARDRMAAEPGLAVRVLFALGRPPYVHVLDEPGAGAGAAVTIDYGTDDEVADGGHLLFRDPWIAVSPASADAGRPLALMELASARLLLPPLGLAQLAAARAYCARLGLMEPDLVEADAGTLEGLLRDGTHVHLVAPRSLLAATAERAGLVSRALPDAPQTPVIARHEAGDPQARAYVEALVRRMAASSGVVPYRPAITLRQLRYFFAAHRHRSASAAARALNVAQPALSGQIRKLEAVAGVPLFERRRSGLHPLPQADFLADFLAPALQLVDGMAAGAARYQSAHARRLAFGHVPVADPAGPLALALAAALTEWQRLYPAARLLVTEAPAEQLRRLVDAGEIGLALVETQVSRSAQLDLQNAEPLGVVTGRAHALLGPGPVRLADALALPLVLPPTGSGLRHLVERAAAEAGLSIRVAMEAGSLPLLPALLAQSPVAAVLPLSSVATAVADGRLAFHPIRDPELHRRLSVLFSPERSLDPVERDLTAALRRHLALAQPSP